MTKVTAELLKALHTWRFYSWCWPWCQVFWMRVWRARLWRCWQAAK